MFVRQIIQSSVLRHLKLRPLVSSNTRRRYRTKPYVVTSPFKDVDIPNINLSEFVWRRLDEWPDKPAVVCGISGQGYTYSELRATCRRFASGLKRAGFEPGQVLAVILPNTPDYAVAMLGAIEAELVVTTVNPVYLPAASAELIQGKLLVPAEIAKQLVDSNVRVIVTQPEKYADVMEATLLAGESGYQTPMIIVTPSLETRFVPRGDVDFGELIATSGDVSSVKPYFAVTDKTPVILPYSSGTTGLPKGVLLSHRNMIANFLQIQSEDGIALAQPTNGGHQDCIPAVLPFYHVYGFAVILLSKLAIGCKIVTLPKFEPKSFLNTLQQHKASLLYTVPPLVLFLGSSPDATPAHFSSVRFVMSGAAPIGAQDLQRLRKKIPPSTICVQAYGMTETSPLLFQLRKNTAKLDSVGPCLPSVVAKIINPETGVALGPRKMGEVCVQGPQNMLGYYNNPQATADMIDKDGWLHTGDLGYYDEDKDFFIVDRLKELIKVKGFQVAPAELEELLRSHPDVLDAAVIGIPDARTGEVPLGFIVPRPGAACGIEKTVMEFVARKVSSFKHLAAVKCIEIIPKSPAGKILRKILRDEYKNLDVKSTSGSR